MCAGDDGAPSTPHLRNHISPRKACCCFIEISSPSHTKQLYEQVLAGSLLHSPLSLSPPIGPRKPTSVALSPPLGQLPQELQPSGKQAKEGVVGAKTLPKVPPTPAAVAGSAPTKGLPVLTELTCGFSPTNKFA